MRKARKPIPRTLNVESLEAREVPAIATLYGSSLIVDGTNESETLVVRQDGSSISVDGTPIRVGYRTESVLPTTRVSTVIVRAQSGDDTINIATLKVNAMVWGGQGNDRIYGGNDIAYGDQGNDTILGPRGMIGSWAAKATTRFGAGPAATGSAATTVPIEFSEIQATTR